MIDPFETAPADEAQSSDPAASGGRQPTWQDVLQAPVAVPTPARAVAVAGNGDLSVTFKGDGTFAYPWIVPKYAGVAEALIDLGADRQEVESMSQGKRWEALFGRAKKMNDHFAGLGGGPAPVNAAAPQRQLQPSQPAGSVEAPSWAPPKPEGCEDFVYVTKIKKDTGRPWHAWMPPGKDDQRPAKFFYPPR